MRRQMSAMRWALKQGRCPVNEVPAFAIHNEISRNMKKLKPLHLDT